MRDFWRGIFTPVLSVVVESEIADAPRLVIRAQYAEFLDPESAYEFIEISAEADELANQYLNERILPQSARNDALHVALATIAEVDALVSWDRRHIVNPNNIPRFNQVNADGGSQPLRICTPREVYT